MIHDGHDVSSATPMTKPSGGGALVEVKPVHKKPERADDRSSLNAAVHLIWPADRFYWVVIDDPHIVAAANRLAVRSGKARVLRPSTVAALAYAVEPDLPVPMDDLHAVGIVSGGSVVVCATERDRLQGLPPAALSLTPAGLPEHIPVPPGMHSATSTALNMLQQDFEPPPLKALRAKLQTTATLAACIALLLVATGFWRRSVQWSRAATQYAAAASEVAGDLYPEEHPTAQAALALAAQELADAQAVQSLTHEGQQPGTSNDCATALASLLATWPTSVNEGGESFQTEVVSLTDTTINATVLTSADARVFLDRFTAPQGWQLDQPRLSQSPTGMRLAVQMTRQKADPRQGPPSAKEDR